MEKETNFDYSTALKEYRQRHNEAELCCDAIEKLSLEVGPLHNAEICLTVGTGYGQFDIMFIKRFLPNLKKLIVVDKDRHCLEELKVNLVENFGSELLVEFHEMPIESFTKKFSNSENGIVKKVNIVLAMHALYELKQEDLSKFFECCASLLLEPISGRFAILSKINDPKYAEACRQINVKMHTPMEQVEMSLRSLGFSVLHERHYKIKVDASNLLCLGRIIITLDHPVSDDDLTEAMKRVVVDGFFYQESRLSIFGRDAV